MRINQELSENQPKNKLPDQSNILRSNFTLSNVTKSLPSKCFDKFHCDVNPLTPVSNSVRFEDPKNGPKLLSSTIIFNQRSFTTNDRWFSSHFQSVTIRGHQDEPEFLCLVQKTQLMNLRKWGVTALIFNQLQKIFTRPFLDGGCAKWLINGLDSHLCKIVTNHFYVNTCICKLVFNAAKLQYPSKCGIRLSLG